MNGTEANAMIMERGTRTGIDIEVDALPGSDLLRDYLAGAPGLAPFFTGAPSAASSYRHKAEAVAARLPASRRGWLKDALRPTSDAAARKLERVIAGEGVFVTTGQQAGLFGGPLYTVYKILTAVRLAEALEPVLDRPVAALFWIAADDHDWAEVNHTFVVDAAHEVRRIEVVSPDGQAPRAMSRRHFTDAVTGGVVALLDMLPDSEFAEPLRAAVRDAYRPGRTVADAFEDLLAAVFRNVDLLLVSAAHPAVKRHAAPVLRRELLHAHAHADLLAGQTQRLVAAGYHEQVTISDNAANVFFHDEYGRERLVREDGSWLLRRTKRAFTDAELATLLEERPDDFSPNVLLRPVVESTLFPTVSYVGGPSEIAYFAQIGCLFHAHDVLPPVVFPRASLTLVEAKVRKVLDKFGLTTVDVRCPFHELVTRLARDEVPPAVTSALNGLRRALVEGYGSLGDAAAIVDPTLRGRISNTRNQALAQIDDAEKKITSHVKKRHETEMEQLRKAAAHIYPDGGLQERTLNAVPFLAKYGPGLLSDLREAIPIALDGNGEGWTGVECGDAGAAAAPAGSGAGIS